MDKMKQICVLVNNYIIDNIQDYVFIVIYILVTARSSGILKAKQKLGVTFNSDTLESGIDVPP